VTDINISKIGQIGQVGQVGQVSNPTTAEALKRSSLPQASFKNLLDEQLAKNSRLQFSKHAMERVDQRGIALTEDLLSSLDNAVKRAREKGARDVVVIDTTQAFIVNVPNNTVITTINDREMRENVFTNIDSAVII